jgi:hypothetical protein
MNILTPLLTEKKCRPLCVSLALAVLLISGCSKGPPFGQVTGKVTLDGKEIADGSIRFVPLDGNTATAGGTIKNGAFDVRVPVNKVRVEISAASTQGIGSSEAGTESFGGDGNYVMPVDLIPVRYNGKSELTLDVAAGANPIDYDLKTK